jgi:UDP-GlcNAc:undecaprenyl-phosphate GlcNAc-1-phosphate transferase
MDLMLSFILALSLSTAVLPALIRYAPNWRLLDAPDARKQHVGLIPRVGGIAIALGTLLSATVWSFNDMAFVGFLCGSIVIVAFGLWDDRNDLNYRIKFGGQMAGALIATMFGIQLTELPLLSGPLELILLLPVSAFILLAATNAFNLLDGLDGLAAGCGILSLAAIGVLALMTVDGGSVVFVTAAALGGILGFLRYNTHPAIVYMGDAGSQFLGFAVGASAMLLIERSGGAISPFIILPILGLPVLDTALVMVLRLRERRSPFSPDRNHIHHRLLAGGLSHREAVAAIYLVQTTLVASAIVFAEQGDLIVASVYVVICGAAAIGYIALHRRHRAAALKAAATNAPAPTAPPARALPRLEFMRIWLVRYISVSLVLYLLAGAIFLKDVTADIASIALCCAGLTVLGGLRSRWATIAARLASYLAVIYVSYLSAVSADPLWLNSLGFYLWLASVAVSISIVMATKARSLFKPSTQDLLTILVVVAIVALPSIMANQSIIAAIAARALVFLYACELLIALKPDDAPRLGFTAVLSLVGLATLHGLPYIS